jgi:hypothetical protein
MFGNNDGDNSTSNSYGDTSGAIGSLGAPPSIDAVVDDLKNDSSTPLDVTTPSLTDSSLSDVQKVIQANTDDPSTNDLIDIKSQALKQLSPLVNHLQQTPEEKFRTTMMMIQASDNQDLIKDAYEAAQQITDDKSKAQALLDVVNEINYFTQHA